MDTFGYFSSHKLVYGMFTKIYIFKKNIKISQNETFNAISEKTVPITRQRNYCKKLQ